MGLLTRILRVPTIGKTVTKILVRKGFKPLEIPIENALEKQMTRLEKKFGRMEGTEIGRKLGVRSGTNLQDLPITDYSFYSDFFNNPTPSAFMYPLEDYVRARTSGTSGVEKWFLLPKEAFPKAFRETGVLILLSLFHDGDRITLEYGDVYYINSAPRPFIAGVMSSLEDTGGIVNVVPNFNLAYDDKVQYFIHNYEKIDATGMLASTFVSQIMPALQKPIKLKGFAAMDSTVAEVYMKEIEEFVGAVPKSAYTSTETNHSSIASVQYPLGFIFDWRRGVFEVLPIKEGKRVKDELIGLEDAKVGEVYNLIYTSFDGELTRYDTGDVLLCVARGDDIINTDFPVFKFYARSEKTIELHSFTRISEEELLTVFKESNISLVDFTTRVEIDRGLQYLVIYMAYRGDMTTKDIEERVHNKLFEIDRDYKELVEFFKYKPIRVQRVPKEVLEEYLRGKIAGVPKVEKIKMREEEFNRLLRIMERHKKCR